MNINDKLRSYFQTLKDSDDYTLRNSVIQRILETDNVAFANFVIDNLHLEEDEEILAYMAEMTVRKELKNRATMILPLINSRFPMLRCHICGLLGNCGDEQALDSLIDRLKNDEDVNVRTTAAHSLGRIGDIKAITALIWSKENDFAEDKDGWSVSVIAERAIAEIKKKKNKQN